MIKGLFDRLTGAVSERLAGARPSTDHAAALYGAVVARSRSPHFFTTFAVPDTFDGRFEALTLHVFLLSHRLKDGSGAARAASQGMFDAFLDDIDGSLREAGVGDQTVPKRINKMTRVFYGRIGAYEAALSADDPSMQLAEVVSRNISPEHEGAPSAAHVALGAHIADAVDHLARQDEMAVLNAAEPFPRIPQTDGRP